LPMSSSTSTSTLPSGLAVLSTFPDVLFIPEIIFGGLVWILVASSKVPDSMLQGWVMFVSVFCFVMSFSLLCLYLCGAHGGGSGGWVTLVRACDRAQGCALQSWGLLLLHPKLQPGRGSMGKLTGCCVFFPSQVFAFVATLLYVIHKVFSLLRWKSS
ncbi:MAL protein, partial [Pomatorhinus ruficollis]|nr:MAL protein [Pomatorhinus ruficollis]